MRVIDSRNRGPDSGGGALRGLHEKIARRVRGR